MHSRFVYIQQFLCIILLLPKTLLAEFDHTHQEWHQLLQSHVHWLPLGHASQVDYSRINQVRGKLKTYLTELSSVPETTFVKWTQKQRLAFLINAYNAFTIELILERYPNLKSIKDLGTWFFSPWKKRFFVLLEKERTLDDIEHGLLRKPGAYQEPRIHFVVVCASIGCPALRNEAFVANKLETQLQDSQQRFLSDKSRNRYNRGKNQLEISSIFDWYGTDFIKKDHGFATLTAYFIHHAKTLAQSPSALNEIRSGRFKIKYLPYDWNLNDFTPQVRP